MNNLLKIRNSKHFTFRELQKLTGVSASTLCRIESSKISPTQETMCKIAAALEVDVCEIFQCWKLSETFETK